MSTEIASLLIRRFCPSASATSNNARRLGRPVSASVKASTRCSSSCRSLAIDSTVKASAIRSSVLTRTICGNQALVNIAFAS